MRLQIADRVRLFNDLIVLILALSIPDQKFVSSIELYVADEATTKSTGGFADSNCGLHCSSLYCFQF